MNFQDLETGDLFVYKNGDPTEFYLRVDEGSVLLVSEDFVVGDNTEDVFKVEPWLVYKEFIKYEMPKGEIDKLIDRLIAMFGYPRSVEELETDDTLHWMEGK